MQSYKESSDTAWYLCNKEGMDVSKELTPKEIKRSVLRAMGIDLPDEMLDEAHDFEFDGDNFKFKTKARMANAKGWKATYGSYRENNK